MIFTGVGGFALMFFGLKKFEAKVVNGFVLLSNETILFSPNNDNRLFIYSKNKININFSDYLYTSSSEDKERVIRGVRNCISGVEMVKINKIEDRLNHSIYHKHRSELARTGHLPPSSLS